MKKSDLVLKQTQRGFNITEFKDSNGVICSLQKSSSAMEDKIWFGANKLGVKEFTALTGWVNRDEFDDVNEITHHYVGNNRMHLTRKQVENLLPYLIHFVNTGEIDLNYK